MLILKICNFQLLLLELNLHKDMCVLNLVQNVLIQTISNKIKKLVSNEEMQAALFLWKDTDHQMV